MHLYKILENIKICKLIRKVVKLERRSHPMDSFIILIGDLLPLPYYLSMKGIYLGSLSKLTGHMLVVRERIHQVITTYLLVISVLRLLMLRCSHAFLCTPVRMLFCVPQLLVRFILL